MPQIAEPHGRRKLVHLGVAAYIGHLLRAVDPEVFQIVQPQQGVRVPADGEPALDGVEDLGGVEGEHGRVPEAGGADPVPRDAEGVSRVIEHGQAVAPAEFGDGVHVAELAVHMHRQHGHGVFREPPLQLPGIQGEGLRLHIAEHRRAAAADDGVGGGGEGEGRGQDLPLMQPKGLQQILQRQVAVGVQGQVLAAQIVPQRRLQRLVLHALVGEPAAVPELPDLLTVFLKGGHGGAGDVDCFVHRLPSFQLRQSSRLSTMSTSNTGIWQASLTRRRSAKESSMKMASPSIKSGFASPSFSQMI